MNYGQRLRIRAVGMGAGSIRAFLFGGLIAVITTGVAAGQTTTRPPVGGVGSPPDAMIFYVAQGAADACGPGCSDWIAAEGPGECLQMTLSGHGIASYIALEATPHPLGG